MRKFQVLRTSDILVGEGDVCVIVKSVNLTFHVSDLPRAVSFYEGVLGFEKRIQWPTYVVFDLCGMMFCLEPSRKKEAKQRDFDVYLQVDDVDGAYEELKGKGVNFLTQPADQPWGARTAKFVDPEGNELILVQLRK